MFLIYVVNLIFVLMPNFGYSSNLNFKHENLFNNFSLTKLTQIQNSDLDNLIKYKLINLQYTSLTNNSDEINLLNLNKTYHDLFSKPRNHENAFYKKKFQIKLKTYLNSFGYEIFEQLFRVRYSISDMNKIEYQIGKNIIVTLNGKFSDENKKLKKFVYHKIIKFKRIKIDKTIFNNNITNLNTLFAEDNLFSKQKDKLIVLGAHYDTIYNVSGIQDNGSGSMVLLELARLLINYRHKFNYTIMFVWFDFEESGALGSMAFVNHYLIPNIIKNNTKTFIGAYIFDILLNYDEKDIQKLPIEIVKNSKNSLRSLNDKNFKVNFLSVWYRKNIDTFLLNNINNAIDSYNHSIKILPIEFEILDHVFNKTRFCKYKYYFRGDHSSFWLTSKNNVKYALSAVLLTNMAYWRESNSKCYHKQCDDISQLNEYNLKILIKTIYMIKDAIVFFKI